MIVSITFAHRPWPIPEGVNVNIDPARIAYGVMTGIGFLGAGTIIKQGAGVRGLTTAAAMWCVAAVGMAAGFGMYTLTAIATVMIVGRAMDPGLLRGRDSQDALSDDRHPTTLGPGVSARR